MNLQYACEMQNISIHARLIGPYSSPGLTSRYPIARVPRMVELTPYHTFTPSTKLLNSQNPFSTPVCSSITSSCVVRMSQPVPLRILRQGAHLVDSMCQGFNESASFKLFTPLLVLDIQRPIKPSHCHKTTSGGSIWHGTSEGS